MSIRLAVPRQGAPGAGGVRVSRDSGGRVLEEQGAGGGGGVGGAGGHVEGKKRDRWRGSGISVFRPV